MNILMVCHRLPFPLTTSAFSFRVLHGVKFLHEKHGHNITIVGFRYKDDPEDGLEEYCDKIIAVTLPKSTKKRILYYLLNYLIGLPLGSFIRGSIFDHTFSWKLQREVNRLIKEEYDAIFVAHPYMLPYVSHARIPKILELWAVSQAMREGYRYEKRVVPKLYRLLGYLSIKKYEKSYEKFDVCVVPSEQERELLSAIVPHLNIAVIPFGVDTDFKSDEFEQDFPSLIFHGSMSSIYNERSALYLYNEIYPRIKEKVQNIKLYIVGRDPSKELLKLVEDNSVIVTGYVEDIRHYLACVSVVTLPVHGYGIKTRILEAMAIGKPVITSFEGIHGIDVTPGENIIIANDPEEFARRVIELLNDEKLRKKIGANAKKLMEEEYSWEKMTDKLNEVFQKVVNKR